MKKKLHWLVYGWKLLVLLVLTAAVFSYAMFQGGFVSWFLFYAFLPFVLYAGLFSLYPISAMQAVRETDRTQVNAGGTLNIKITLTRRVPFPLMYMVIEDCLPETLEKLYGDQAAAKRLVFPWFKRKVTMSYRLSPVPRGEHHLHTVRVRTGDVLGLVEKEAYYEVKHSFLVFPSYQFLHFQPNERHLEEGISSSAPFQMNHSMAAASVREYQPGDRIAALDWKTSARRSQLMTKEFEPSKNKNLFLLMDRSPSVSFEEAVSAAASILHSVLKSGTGAGLASAGKERSVFPIQQGEQHFQRLMHHLAVVACDAAAPLSCFMEEELAQQAVRHADKVVVTGQVTEDLVRAIEISSGSMPVTIILAKEKEAALSQAETIMIERLLKRGTGVRIIKDGGFSQVF
ncbi:DUF58 domain-containing protein [Bacillus atrophaeus]|uniref:DUF58 domain-containing protein n=1 Tax=Bacillus atrophaeus TaxID=1452 RepID=UPI001BABDE8C|nr:DUF58 domain-containing protein [Bacillus atrophaeus]QUF66125.1 DUF58 domain-containing protein [Bacillus atrophaeus]